MEPNFRNKSLLIVEPDIVAENLDYVLAVSDEKKVIFRQLLTDGEDSYLKPLNPLFNDFINIKKERFNIVGTVIQYRENFKQLEHFIHDADA